MPYGLVRGCREPDATNSRRRSNPRGRLTRHNALYLVIAILTIVAMRDAWVGMRQVQTIPYSEFQPA